MSKHSTPHASGRLPETNAIVAKIMAAAPRVPSLDEAATAAYAIAVKIRAGKLASEFSSSDVLRLCWSGLTDLAVVHAALDLLVEIHWLGVRQEQTGGRPRTVYVVNHQPFWPIRW